MHKKFYNYKAKEHEKHPFHLVDPSPWPIMTAISLWSTVLGIIAYFHFYSSGVYYMLFGVFSLCFCLTAWFYDIVRESTYQGFHTFKVQQNIYLGMILFIVSEVVFFVSFFWAFFYFSYSPSIWIGGVWPPLGIYPINPWSYPLTNTLILLTSGVYITVAHQAIRVRRRQITTKYIMATIVHGSIFFFIQLYEYNTVAFSINDGVYGSIFYILTVLHGFHVLIGTIFFVVCLIRHYKYHFWKRHHVGFVCAIWYWHFVDIVWIFLYFCLYVWGS